MSSRGQTMNLVKRLRKAGFEVERTGSGHWKVTNPKQLDKGFVVMAFSPKNPPGHQTYKRLRGIGYDERSK